MKALSLCQPYASMVAGQVPGWEKLVETRIWSTSHRGPLLICAALKPWPAPRGYTGPDPRTLPRGVALCVVDVVDCRPMRGADWAGACCDYYARAFGWHLTNRRAVRPFEVKGRQKLFDVDLPADVAADLAAAEARRRPLRTDLPEPAVGQLLPASLVVPESLFQSFASHV